MRIILASKSPRRSEILDRIGVDFQVLESEFTEAYDTALAPPDVVRYLSYQKAKRVADKINDMALVIGADTVVVYDDIIMGKPVDDTDSFNMLKKLSGKWHKVYTGISIINTISDEYIQDIETTDVKVKQLTDEEIWHYIKTGEPVDKAGSYAIQGIGSLIVEKINGCYYNVVGLPVFKLSNMLGKFGVNLLGYRS